MHGYVIFGLGASPQYYGYYGYSSGPIWLYSIDCNGNETSLFDCPHYGNSYYYYYHDPESDYDFCDHSMDIGVICPGTHTM